MTLQEIKKAITQGKQVFWKTEGYRVIRIGMFRDSVALDDDSSNQYLIKCDYNGHCIGLTWTDGVTMNGKEEEFFVV